MKFSKKKLGIYLGVILLFMVGIFGINKLQEKNKAQISDKSVSIAVNIAPAELSQEAEVFTYNASLEPFSEGIVSSMISGKVVKVMVEEGQAVTPNKPLIKLEDRELQNSVKSAEQQILAAQSQLKSAQNQLLSGQTSAEKLKLNVENAQRIYDQEKALYEQGAAAKTEVDNAESAFKAAQVDLASGMVSVQSAQIAVETAQVNVNSAQVTYNNATDALKNSTICAPIGGVLDEKAITLGQCVAPGAVLAKVKNVSSLNAAIHVEQSGMSQLKKGMMAQIMLKDSDTSCTGTLSEIGVSADETNRTYTCKVAIKNENGALHPGDFVTVNLISDTKADVITIPLQALVGNERDYAVFVVENGVAKKVSVSIGKISENRVVITSGITKDQSVIVTNLNRLQDGDAITVVEGNGP